MIMLVSHLVWLHIIGIVRPHVRVMDMEAGCIQAKLSQVRLSEALCAKSCVHRRRRLLPVQASALYRERTSNRQHCGGQGCAKLLLYAPLPIQYGKA